MNLITNCANIMLCFCEVYIVFFVCLLSYIKLQQGHFLAWRSSTNEIGAFNIKFGFWMSSGVEPKHGQGNLQLGKEKKQPKRKGYYLLHQWKCAQKVTMLSTTITIATYLWKSFHGNCRKIIFYNNNNKCRKQVWGSRSSTSSGYYLYQQ